MNIYRSVYLLLNLAMCTTWGMHYTEQEQLIIRHAVYSNDIELFTTCFNGILQNCIIDYEFRTNPELCINPLQQIFQNVCSNPDILKQFCIMLHESQSILSQGSFFLPEALFKGYKKLSIPSWMEQLAEDENSNLKSIETLIAIGQSYVEQDSRYVSRFHKALLAVLESAIKEKRRELIDILKSYGATLDVVDAPTLHAIVKKADPGLSFIISAFGCDVVANAMGDNFSTQVTAKPTADTIQFCLTQHGMLSSQQWLQIVNNEECWRILRARISLSEMESLLGIENLFSCIVQYNDIEATQQLLPSYVQQDIPQDIESAVCHVPALAHRGGGLQIEELLANKGLLRLIPRLGGKWLCVAAGCGNIQIADLLVAAGADIEQAFMNSWCQFNYYEGRYLECHHEKKYRALRYLSSKLPASQFFSKFRQMEEEFWLYRIFTWGIRLNDRRQKEELVEYLLQNPIGNNYVEDVLTGFISLSIMHKKPNWCTGQPGRADNLVWLMHEKTKHITFALFLAIFWHENDVFHKLYEQNNNADGSQFNTRGLYSLCHHDHNSYAGEPILRIDSRFFGSNFFECAIIFRNIALAKDMFLLGGCQQSHEQIVESLKKHYWSSDQIDEFMRFVEGVYELDASRNY